METQTQMELFPELSAEESTSSLVAPLVNHSQWQGTEQGFGDYPDSPSPIATFLRQCAPIGSCGKMSRGYFRPTEEKTSEQSLPNLMRAGILAHGEYWTLNMCEHTVTRQPFPSAEGVCSLSDILEPIGVVPQRYYLSATACLGILRRAESRGKQLPQELKEALQQQARSQTEQESRGGGKGPLVSDEVSLTLNTQNNQALVSVHGAQTPHSLSVFAHPLGAKNCGLENCFVQKIYSIDSAESNSMKSANPNSGVHEADVARTLDTTDPNPTKRQGGQMVMQVINDQGGKCINLEKQEVPPTIRREMKHHEPLIAYPINSMVLGKDLKAGDRQTVGIGEEGEPLPTLQAAHHHAVAMTSCVRRIMPIECERLMGFPDNWTRIPWRGKPEEECPSNPRFKACGNSMTVPQMRWIGIGIDEVERIMRNAQAIETKKENTK